MANLPGDPAPPTGGPAQDATTSDSASPAQGYQLPDCIIVSSNRFNDIRPYCDSIYYNDLKKWGDIMPWEYPFKPTHEQDAAFLRKWFSETEIHMQGGAHGPGNGFRFLKQVWISIALWNWEKRMPSIAQWWLQQEDNQRILADPAMKLAALSPDVTVETFFEKCQIETYGSKLLGLVVKQIQAVVKANQADHALPSGDGVPELDANSPSHGQDVVTTHESAAQPSQAASNDASAEPIVSPSTANPTDSGPIIPFPKYNEPLDASRPTHIGYSQSPAEQPYGQKRGFSSSRRFSSGGIGRLHARQDWQPQQDRSLPYNPSATFDPVASNSENFMSNRAQSQAFTAGGPPANVSLLPSPYMGPGYMNPGMTGGYTAQDPSIPPRMMRDSVQFEHHYGGMANNTGFMQTRGDGRFETRNFTHEPNFSGSEAYLSDFVRHRCSSQGSRGGSYRGQSRGGRGRGRGRGSFNEPIHVMENQQAFSADHAASVSYNHRGRRGDASRMSGWRSHSDRPQDENVLPRILDSNWSQYTGSQPTFQSMPDQAFGSQQQDISQALSYQPPAAYPPFPVAPPPNMSPGKSLKIAKNHIPEDARHVCRLVFFNIPCSESDNDVKKTIAHVCGIQVLQIHRSKKPQYGTGHDEYSPAHVDLPSHHAARRVLGLRDVKLYGKDLTVEVARQFWDNSHKDFEKSQKRFSSAPDINRLTGQPSHQSHSAVQPSAAALVPGQIPTPMHSPMCHGPLASHRSLQDVRVDPGSGMGDFHAQLMQGHDSASYDMNRMTSLSTVHSVDTTPTASGNNTPKKKKQKHKNKTGRKDTRADPQTSLSLPSLTSEDVGARNTDTSDSKGSDLPAPTPPVPSAATKPVAAGDETVPEVDSTPRTPTSSDRTVRTRSLVRGQTDGADSTTGEENNSPTPSSSQRPRQTPAPTATVSESEQADDSFHTARDTPAFAEADENISAPTSSKRTVEGKPQTTSGRSLDGKVATPTRPLRKSDITINVPSGAGDEVGPEKPVSEEQQAVESPEQRSVSGASHLPTPAFHTAPTTPAVSVAEGEQTSQSTTQESQEKASSQKPKAIEKQKGPATTESFSMFGKKKSGKKAKPVKPQKATNRQPSEAVQKSNKPSLDPQQQKQGNRGHESAKKTGVGAQDEASKQTTQPTTPSSPGKRSFASLLSYIPGMISKTPSVASKSVHSEVSNEPELTNSKVQPAQSLAVRSTDMDSTDKVQVVSTKPANEAVSEVAAARNNEVVASDCEPTGAEVDTIVEGNEIDSSGNPATTKDLGSNESIGLGITQSTETTTNNNTPSNPMDGPNSGKQSKKKKRSKKRRPGQNPQQEAANTASGEVKKEDDTSLAITTTETASEVNQTGSDQGSEHSSHTMSRPTPPASPAPRLAAKRKTASDHILTAPPPRNQHVKRQSSSKFEGSSQVASESKEIASIESYRKSDIARRQGQMLQLYTLRDASAILKRQLEDGAEGELAEQLVERRVWLLTPHPDDTPSEPTRLAIFAPADGVELVEDGGESDRRVVEVDGDTEMPEASSAGMTEMDSEPVNSDE